MKENNYKPQMPDVMEVIFDAVYLIFDLVAAVLFFIFSKGNTLFVLYGVPNTCAIYVEHRNGASTSILAPLMNWQVQFTWSMQRIKTVKEYRQ